MINPNRPRWDASDWLITLISVATVIAMLAGWVRYGRSVDAESAWRERVR